MSTKGKFILGALVILGSFLLGFVPELREAWRLQAEIAETRAQLAQSQLQVRIDKLGNIAGRMVLEGLHQNYGVAQELATQYFDGLTQLASETEDPALKMSLSSLLGERDSITAGLTQANPLVLRDLQSLLGQTYDIADAVDARK